MTPRKTLATYGRRGDLVRVLLDRKRGRVIVHYRDGHGVKRRKFYANDKDGKAEAKTWAAAYHDERKRLATTPERPRLTLRQLWTAYREAAFSDLRPRTQLNYTVRWKKWEEYLSPDAWVDDTTLHHVDQFRKAARESGMALNQVRNVIAVARIVYNWGQTRKLVTTNDLALFRWKQPKDAPVLEPEEYTSEEFDRMLPHLDRTKQGQWRAWVVLMLAGHEGQRANAVLHLRWPDIDFAKGELTWPAAFQKQGKALHRPLTFPVYSALLTARLWAEKTGCSSEWVLPAPRDPSKPYGYQAFHRHLIEVEKRAKVAHKPYRAMHGFRRMVVGEIGERSGDRMLGLEYVGDNDPKMLKRYDKRGPERISRAAELIEQESK